MTHKQESDILTELLTLTNATPVPTSDDDVRTLADLAQQARASWQHSQRATVRNAEIKREADLLAGAKRLMA